MRKKVMFISEDTGIFQNLKDTLQDEATEITCFPCAEEALRHFLKRLYCLVIVDITHPDTEIYEILRTMRKNHRVPVLTLVDELTSDERTALLQAGATAYLKKPFSMEECNAQANALIRLYAAANPDISRHHTLAFGTELIIDPTYWQVTQNGRSVELTHKEFNLLYYLASHEGQVMTHEQIYNNVWRSESDINLEGTIKTHISSLRQKLNLEDKVLIENVRSVGYRFVDVSKHTLKA